MSLLAEVLRLVAMGWVEREEVLLTHLVPRHWLESQPECFAPEHAQDDFWCQILKQELGGLACAGQLHLEGSSS